MTVNPVFCAIDRPDLDGALALAGRLGDSVGGLKLGLELFTSQGPAGVRAVRALGLPIFLDLKLHDIPNTVARAAASVAELGIAMLTIHAAGGVAMLRGAAEAVRGIPGRPKLLAITVLTSLDAADLAATGITADPTAQAVRLAKLAQDCGIDGVICSPYEIGPIRAACGTGLTLVVPGIRPAGSGSQDQKRVMTPAEAIAAGADHLVIGRPITAAPDPAAAARAIRASLTG